jgi:hypothetical protein
MALILTINGTDYTKYLVPNITPVYDDPLNQSKTLTLSIYAADKNFNIVTKGEFVRLAYSGGTVFSGYITGTPVLEVVSTGFVGYNLIVKSEESVFDVAAFGFQSPFVGQFAGDILKSIILLANPKTTLDFSKLTPGPFVPYFAIDNSWTFTQAAYALAQKVGFRWWILNGVVHFAPQNDSPYGYSIDTTQPSFIPQNLNFLISNSPIYNDVTALGPSEPQTFVEETYWGDGNTSEYILSQTPFTDDSTSPLFDDYFQSAALDPTLWNIKDPNSAFLYASKNLTVSGGSTSGFNQTVLSALNTFELGGELLFDHGSVTFNAISVGLFGGLYSSNNYASANCIASFYFTGAATTSGITGFVNGQQVGSTVITQNNHSYRLQTYISADEIYRFHDNYRSMNGQYGGDLVACDAYVTLVVLDTDLSNPTATPVQTVIYDQLVQNIPAFAYYGYINSLGMFFTTKRGPIISTLPSVRVRSTLSGRLQPSINFVPDSNAWSISVGHVPSNGEGIWIQYRKIGVAQSRLINTPSLNTNGRKPATLNVQTLARTYADCENISQAFLNDHNNIVYEGYYTQPSGVLTGVPQSGKYVSVNNPSATQIFVSIVREVVVTFTDTANEKATVKTIFGFAPLFTQYFPTNVLGTIASTDFSLVPQYLPSNSTLRINAVSASQISVLADKNPIKGFEVRTSDTGWGTGGFVLQTNAAGFNVGRLSHSDTFYFREFDGGAVPKYSKFSNLLSGNGYPLSPPAPSTASSILIGANIIYTIVLQGDTTDVYGVEIRQTDDSTVVYHALYQSNADLSFVQQNVLNLTSITGYKFYTFNSHGDYSASTSIDGILSAGGGTPNPPTGLTFVTRDYVKAADGTIFAELTVQWTPSTTPNAVYLIRYTLHGTTNYSYMPVGAAIIATITGLALNTSYDISVCAVGETQSQSSFTTALQVSTTASTTAPATPTGLNATGGFRVIGLTWTANADTDLAGYIVQFSTDNITFNTIARTYTNLFVDTGDAARGVLNVSTTYYYKIAAFNTNGQASSFTASVNATTTQVGTTDIAANSITGNMIQANTITAAKITSVNASAVTGTLVPGNIPSLDASKITTGTFIASQIPGLDASKLISGTIWGQNVTTTTIDGNHITTGTVTANQLAAISRFSISKSVTFTGTASGLTWTAGYLIVPDNTGTQTMYTISAQITAVTTPASGKAKYIIFTASTSTVAFQATSDVTDGTLPTLPSDAFVIAVWHGGSDITVFSGQTVIDGGHIQANSITATNISSVNASAVTGVLVPGNIPSLDASKITTGTFIASQIPGLDASKLISGTLWGENVTSTTIDGSHITTGTVTANQLAAIARFSISKSIIFTGNANGLTWTGGYVIVPNSSGTPTMFTITAQSTPIAAATGANGKYIYFSSSTSTTALQITGSVADGTLPTLPSDAFVIAVWHGLADVTVFSGQTVIDGGHIQTNTITANNIAANTITTSRLIVSDGTNLIGNPSGESGLGIDNWTGGVTGTTDADPNMLIQTAALSGAPWSPGQLTSVTDATTDTTDPVGGNNATKLVCNGGTDPTLLQQVNSVGTLLGQTFTASYWIKGTGATIGKTCAVFIFDQPFTEAHSTQFVITGSWQRVSNTYTFTTSTAVNVTFRIDPVDIAPFASGDTVYVWGPELQTGSTLSDYFANGATRVYTGNNALIQTNRDGYFGQSASSLFGVTPGDVYRFYVEAYPSATNPPAADFTVGLHLRTTPTTITGETWVGQSSGYTSRLTQAWRAVRGQVTVPSGVAYAQIWTQINATAGSTGTWYFRNLIVNKAASADLLVDGSITSAKLITGAISVGGAASMPDAINVADGGGTTVATIGSFTSTLIGGGTIYGGWFKTLAVGGTANNPNLVADASGNLFLLGGQIYNSHGIFSESFEYDITKYWNLRAGGTGGVTYPLNGVAGGRVLDTTSYIWEAYPQNIPFDPSKLYRMRARVRKTAGAGGSQVFVGVEGVASDGTTLVNATGANLPSSQHYVCLNGLNVGVSSNWVTYTGYFKGNAASNAVLTTPNSVNADPMNPSQLNSSVRYIRPMFILNFSSLTDTWDIDQITIDIIPDNLDSIADSQNWVRSGTQAQDNIVMTGVCAGGGGNDFAYRQISNTSYTIASGDKLQYDVFGDIRNPEFAGGVDFEYSVSHTTFRGVGANSDQNGISTHADVSAWAKGRWYRRSFDLTSLAGQTINTWAIALEGNTAGTYFTRFANIVVLNGSTLKTTVYSSGAVTDPGIPWSVGGAGSDTGYSAVKIYAADLSAGSASLDYHVADGSTYTRFYATSAEPLLDNPNFELGGSLPLGSDSGWTLSIGSGANVNYETGSPLAGNRSLKVSGTTGNTTEVNNKRQFVVRPGDTFLCQALGKVSAAGVVGRIGIQFSNAGGGGAGQSNITFTTTSATTQTFQATASGTAVSAFVFVTYDPSSTVNGDAFFDSILVSRVRSMDNEIFDGTNYGRTALSFYGPGGPSGRYSGFPVNDNPDFVNGLTRYSVYDNNATGHVTLSLVADITAPNASGQKMRVSYSAGGENPGWGGFFLGFANDSGTVAPFTYHRGDTLIHKIIANIPTGYAINFASNATGTPSSFTWLSSTAGTGAWATYIAKQIIGTSGTFSSTGFYYLTGQAAPPASFDVAHCEVVDIDQIIRYGVISIDANYRAGIDFTQALHIGKNTDNISDATGSPLAGGKRGFLAIDSGNIVITTSIDFSRSYTGKQQDNIPDGTTFGRLRNSILLGNTIAGRTATGRNLAANPGFEIDNTGINGAAVTSVGAVILEDWLILQNDNTNWQFIRESGGSEQHSGKYNLLMRLSNSQAIAAGAVTTAAAQNQLIPSTPGATVYISAWQRWDENATVTGGSTSSIFGLIFRDLNGTLISTLTAGGNPTANTGYAQRTNSGTIPSNCATMQVFCQASFNNNGSGNGAFNTSTNLYADMRFDDVSITVASDITNEVLDGSGHYRPRSGILLPADTPHNGSFEIFPDTATVADGWTSAFEVSGTGGTYARSTTAFAGTYSQSITNVAASAGGTSMASRPIGVRPGVSYAFAVRAQSTIANPGTMYFRIVWYSSDSDLTRGSAAVISFNDIVGAGGPTSANTWQLFSGNVTAPATAVFARVGLYCWTSASQTTMLFDTCTMRINDGGNTDNLTDGTGSPISGGKRGFQAITASINIAINVKIGGDSGIGCSGTTLTTTDIFISGTGTTKVHIVASTGHEWSVASV